VKGNVIPKEGKDKKAAVAVKVKSSDANDASAAPVVAASSSSTYAAMGDTSAITDVTSMRSALAQALQGFLPMVRNASCFTCLRFIVHMVML
jgi:hypothetical protein